LLAAAALGYVAILVWFHLNEDALLFHPEISNLSEVPQARHPPGTAVSAAAPAVESGPGETTSSHPPHHDVTFRTADALTLVARVMDPPPQPVGTAGAPTPATAWILYLHGSSGNVATPGYNKAWAEFHRLGLGVMAVDYRGYGHSGGVPSEAGLYLDAEAAYRYLTSDLHVPPARIIIYGYSLGSAVAIDLASRFPAAGLIVEGAFLSIPARGAELYPFLPVAWLAHNRFASVDKMGRVTMPKLFIHARGDTVVPIAHGRRLFELAHAPKYFQEVAGGHVDAYQVDPTFFGAVKRFAMSLGLPGVGGTTGGAPTAR
jgi:pimeloyl-ACP methyl ester carboxylesterase